MSVQQKGFNLLFLIFLLHIGSREQEVAYPYSEEVSKFKSLDSISPPPQRTILFIGSSSFTYWKDVQQYFPEYTIVNRAFGGSTLEQVIHYVNDVVYVYNPIQVVIYCGENDFASSDTITPEIVNKRFETLFKLIRNRIPDVKITYIAMKPSPLRWNLKEKFIQSNKYIRKFLRKQKNTSFVDIWPKMLDKNGQPNKSIFLEDQLHMNSQGYIIWHKAIKPHLINKVNSK